MKKKKKKCKITYAVKVFNGQTQARASHFYNPFTYTLWPFQSSYHRKWLLKFSILAAI